jgi:dynactin complex subunit
LGRLPAPLAFTGLPLISEESTTGEESAKPEQPPPIPVQTQSSPKRNRLRQQHSSTASSYDELSKYFSKPALRAIEHRSASDSFYVVPTSGHTMSYANILTFADKEKRRLEASSLHSGSASIEDDDDFVDAHESPTATHSQSQLSVTARRRVGKARSEKDLHNVIEELCMENNSLKEMIDKLSKRLQAFEASSQRLAESRIMARPGSPATTSPGGAPGSGSQDTLRRANIDLEEKWSVAQQKIEMLEKDNDKMQRTLFKYRQKWDSLKETAKARRAQPPGGESAGQS